MGWLESRILILEQRMESIYRRLLAIETALKGVRQTGRAAYQQMPSSGGSSGGFFVAWPSSTVSGATWSAGVPTAGVVFTADVWQVSYNGSSQTITALGSQNCVNWLAAGLVASQGVIVVPDGAGSYGVGGQSCV